MKDNIYVTYTFKLVIYASALACTCLFADQMSHIWLNHTAVQHAQNMATLDGQHAKEILTLKAQHAEQLAHQARLVELKLRELNNSMVNQQQAGGSSVLNAYLKNVGASMILSQVAPFVLKIGLTKLWKITLIGKAFAWFGFGQDNTLAQITQGLAANSGQTQELARIVAQQGVDIRTIGQATEELRSLGATILEQQTLSSMSRMASESSNLPGLGGGVDISNHSTDHLFSSGTEAKP